MLIQSSLPLSMSTSLPFASDHGKQESMDLSCDWSHCDKTWQMSPKFDECPLNGCTQSISNGKEQIKSSTTNFTVSSETYSDLSTIKCTSSAARKYGKVYKRRKLYGNSFAPSPEENATASAIESSGSPSSISSEELPLTSQKDDLSRLPIVSVRDFSRVTQNDRKLLISGQHHLQMAVTALSSQIELVPHSTTSNTCSVREDEVPEEASIGDPHKSTSDRYSSVNDRCSSPKSNKGHGSTLTKTEVDAGDCSSFDDVVVEHLGEFTSAKELCISVLKSHGLLGGLWTSTECTSLEALCDNDTKLSQSCKLCGILENPLIMLICDLCEEAFHLSCCNPKVKKLPLDEWYCQPCFRNKPKALRKRNTGKSFDIMGERAEHRRRISLRDLGPISFMLKDVQPHTSRVRIGKDFQVEVPEWSGPIDDDHACSGEPLEMDPAKDGWTCNMPFKPSSIGNWIQCRAVIDDEGTRCGKWRRAPLFVVQTNDWDCSCSVLWDPVHADCAVPQEWETKVVLEHLRYIEMLRPRLADKKSKAQSTMSDAPQ